MGSDSDLKVMSKAAVMLEELGIEYEMTIISAHREPDELIEWTRGAEDRGIKVMIAGAGMAAALPGMCAALFALPVIGVPLSGKNLDGMDAVFSIMQMPPGVPVATVAIDGAKNAAILAAKILAAGDDAILEKIKKYTADMKAQVVAKDAKLKQVGYKQYLAEKSIVLSSIGGFLWVYCKRQTDVWMRQQPYLARISFFWQRIRHRRQPVFIRAVAHMSRWQRLSILWESYMHLLET